MKIVIKGLSRGAVKILLDVFDRAAHSAPAREKKAMNEDELLDWEASRDTSGKKSMFDTLDLSNLRGEDEE